MTTTSVDDFFSSPASFSFANTSMRQRTQQACDKCRERKTKCSGEKPVCKRCTTRGLICQYTSRETRARGSASTPKLRSAVSSIDLHGSKLHQEKQRERDYHFLRQQSHNLISHDLSTSPSSQFPPQPFQLTSQPLQPYAPYQSHSQPASLSGSPVIDSFPPSQLQLPPLPQYSDSSQPLDPPPSNDGQCHPIRRAQSQSSLPYNFEEPYAPQVFSRYGYYLPNGLPSSTMPPQQHHSHHRSLDAIYNTSQPMPTYGFQNLSLGDSYPPQLALATSGSSSSSFSGSADTSPISTCESDHGSMPLTPSPVIHTPTPLAFQNVQLLQERKVMEFQTAERW
ncbi:uncharacterized protein BT62DRAFT_1004031 [Guyanagaster necrorhizus]|uniref:Zn(2)-C6 fungal-type domain-containing protein n=1 Tax=Guyanagaster necrorhizus TaxID=856835 RepID=A0A9P7VX62_9AGAR|nr:uncharacterized protein BT62DRAFT_1004031 [Guyanagaster necrorhizus MCA 3950]KAG7448238.1 hypothetical protein BT62DRAFT_1004031 [Guyanagaster necrorhizus MCA 3950]